MKRWKRYGLGLLAGVAVLITSGAAVKADAFVIESFDRAGVLIFSEITNATSYSVEWASSPSGPWQNFSIAADALDLIPATGSGSVTSSVPMFYRVVAVLPPPPPDFAVSNSGTSSYLINGEANPELHLVRGQTYTISVNAAGHPFWIKTTATTGTGEQYNDGVTDNGTAVGEIVFTVPLDAPGTLYYICQFHSVMQGVISVSDAPAPIPDGMVQIPGGTNSGTDPPFGAYSLTADSFYMDATQVTKALWDEVYNWAVTNGYGFDNAGSGKATNHPVHTVNWYDVVKWCNARSEKEGRPAVYMVNEAVYKTGQSNDIVQIIAAGYRLPTDTEWEYAARGGLSGQSFPWGDTITIQHARANYWSSSSYSYDTSPTRGYHPTYNDGTTPYTSPVGSFAANGYGLYDMAGNVWEWCFDRHPLWVDSHRVLRGGSWTHLANHCRVGPRNGSAPYYATYDFGFRAVLPPGRQ